MEKLKMPVGMKMPVRVLRAWDGAKGEYVPILVDGDYDGEYFSQFNWRVGPMGHIQSTNMRKGNTHVYLSALVLPPKKGYCAWHKNRDLRDNRSENLEYVTYKQRAELRGQGKLTKRRKSKTGLRWVSYHPERTSTYKGKKTTYKMQRPYVVMVNSKYGGAFETADEAAREADILAVETFGYDKVKGVLNRPDDWRGYEPVQV